jgi:hypothetical protein
MNIADFCSELDLQLGLSAPEERIPLACKMLCKAYKVTSSDVALFALDDQRQELRFRWPEKLTSSGTIPLNAKNSLVARTLREKKAYLDNRFAKSSHGVIFEAFSGDAPIQKIISAPLADKGVIQISRKGVDPKAAGADFSQSELTALEKMAEVIARHL